MPTRNVRNETIYLLHADTLIDVLVGTSLTLDAAYEAALSESLPNPFQL
jgi:hypothetical protein